MGKQSIDAVDPIKVEEFLDFVHGGAGLLNAAYAVDWTPAFLKRLMKDPEFAELISMAQERRIEAIEETLFKVANKGNVRAIETILFCQAADRGWRPPTQRVAIDKTTKIEVSLVQSTVEAARQLAATMNPASLQPGGVLDIIDADVVEPDGQE